MLSLQMKDNAQFVRIKLDLIISMVSANPNVEMVSEPVMKNVMMEIILLEMGIMIIYYVDVIVIAWLN